MPRSQSRSMRAVIAVVSMAVAQLPLTLHADEKGANGEAKEKGDKGKAEKDKAEKGKDEKGEKGKDEKGEKEKDEKGENHLDGKHHDYEDEDDDRDEKAEKDEKGQKGEKKHHKQHADEELFGADDKDEPDPVRLEVHIKGEKVAARQKVAKILEGKPMTEDLREELHRHALITAKLLRIRILARAAKDDAAVTKTNAVLAKERTRHEQFLTSFKSKAEKGSGK